MKKKPAGSSGMRSPQDSFSALQAITEAQKIAFAPFLFQAAWAMRELGILAELDSAAPSGATVQELSQRLDISPYGISVLLDMGLSGAIVWQDGDRYHLEKTGHFLVNDRMTRINMNFTQHVCYQAMASLVESIRHGTPEGLKIFGEWQTIYPALSVLPEPARSAWFDLDHFYSDQAFQDALPYLFQSGPSLIFDLGGNTGRGAKCFVDHDAEVKVTILDIAEQIALAREDFGSHSAFDSRVTFHPIDVLQASDFPTGADVYWMSQFLDCFAEEEIVGILENIRKTMKPEARILILELFWDRQRFDGAAFSLNAISLYFTCLANGNSRFYRANHMIRCIEKAGFEIVREIDGLGLGHTLLECRRIEG